MGKKRIIKKSEGEPGTATTGQSSVRQAKKHVSQGTLYVQSTYNNTKLLLTDKEGNAIFWSSSGSIGFKGAKKGTPFAAAKVGELIGDKAQQSGIKEVDVVVRGVGSGRESSIRAFISKGIELSSIKDRTPIPFNGPKRKKPRTV